MEPIHTSLSSCSPSSVTITRTPSGKIDYDHVLSRFKEEFQRRYTKAKVPSPDMNLRNYDVLAVLMLCAFGRMKIVKEKNTDNILTVKVLLKSNIVKYNRVKEVYNEKNLLMSIKFPFVLSLFYTTKSNDSLYFFMHFVPGVDFYTYYRRMRKFNEKQAQFYAAQAFLVLEYLHKLDVIYRDLKLENLLLDKYGYIKFVDFEFAKTVDGRTSSLCGTPVYLAPEMIQAKPYGKSVDWWAFGVFLFELVAGYDPFSTRKGDILVLYTRICDGIYEKPKNFSKNLHNLVESLLQVDLTQRLGNLVNGSKDIKQHPWFRSVNWLALLHKDIKAPYLPRLTSDTDFSQYQTVPDIPEPQSANNRYGVLFADF